MSESQKFVMIGLPASGKTSFLAALWYLVQHEDVDHRFNLERMEGDSKHLNRISSLWASFEVVPRTAVSIERTVSMVLTDTVEKKTITLTFPDLSGESFMAQWVERHLTKGYDDFLRESVGGVLFISPLNYTKPARIASATPLLKEMGEAEQFKEENEEGSIPWDAAKSPATQVQLVELLQFMAGREYFKPPFRLALVISAWDQLKGARISPAKWLEKEMSFLSQFLESNRRLFDSNVYGVSAQGGDYDKDVNELSRKTASERLLIEGDGVRNAHDLTELLTWLMH
ncbi:MAG: TRAFAC clade GTPase domain-containing protein [Candidatus Acidiferrales bacterium]